MMRAIIRTTVTRATVIRPTGARLVMLFAVGACHSVPATPKPAVHPATEPATRPERNACAALTSELSRAATSTQLAGEYRLRLVPTAGPRSGEAADAQLRLAPLPDSLQMPAPMLGVTDTTIRYPLAGTTDLDPELVGGVPTGDNASTDPAAPGVLVIERHPPAAGGPASVMLRLGALANRRGVARFDGGYFALIVRRIEADGFAGTWSSGTTRQAASGYFCAERIGP